MEKVYGSPKRQDGLYQIGRNKWELIYGFGVDNDGDTSGWNWRKRFINHKPDIEEIKALIKAAINAETDAKILSGFVWKGMPVWLSSENQFNYKAAYDMAVQTDGASLPVTFKFGTDSEEIYHEFATLDELNDFYVSCLSYVQQTLAAGWEEKQGVDWSMYEI